MRPSLLIALLLSIASFSTAAMLFWKAPSKAPIARTTPPSTVDMKWGEGSEAGVPDAAAHK